MACMRSSPCRACSHSSERGAHGRLFTLIRSAPSRRRRRSARWKFANPDVDPSADEKQRRHDQNPDDHGFNRSALTHRDGKRNAQKNERRESPPRRPKSLTLRVSGHCNERCTRPAKAPPSAGRWSHARLHRVDQVTIVACLLPIVGVAATSSLCSVWYILFPVVGEQADARRERYLAFLVQARWSSALYLQQREHGRCPERPRQSSLRSGGCPRGRARRLDRHLRAHGGQHGRGPGHPSR